MNSICYNGKNHNANKLLLNLFLEGVSEVRPKNILEKFLKIEKNTIVIEDKNKKINYENIKNVYPLCIGKASVETAKTLKKIFKNKKKLQKGVVVVNKENFQEVPGFKCFKSGHPIPNQNGISAARYIINLLKNTNINDLVLIFISGGGSALLPMPVEGISLSNKIDISRKLIECGCNIEEINTVRKHLSQVKGGNFLRFCSPSRSHSLILSDVIGDDLSSISSGLTVADPSTFKDAKYILKKYKLWEKISSSIKEHIERGIKNLVPETPKEKDVIFKKSKNTLIGSNSVSLEKIKKICNQKNINAKIWKRNVNGDVRKIAKNFVQDLKKIKTTKPFILISGGETTVKINGNGKGGRNQEFALHFNKYVKEKLPKLKYTFLSAGSDGRDGPTNAAGAIVDQNTTDLIENKKINIEKELENNNSHFVLKQINSLVIIKGTNTNVADIQILAIME